MYKMMLEKEKEVVIDSTEEFPISDELLDKVKKAMEKIEPHRYEELQEPEEGDIIEVVPSPDGGEFIFLVYRLLDGFTEIMPMTKWTEFATSSDVLVSFRNEIYMVQTDLSLDVPYERFHQRLGNRRVFRVGKLSDKDMKRIKAVTEGKAKGAGRMSGGVKREFKKIEAQRYFSIFAYNIAQEEFLASIEEFFLSHREFAFAAAQQEKGWGEKGDLGWIYDDRREILIIKPAKEILGRRIRIKIELEGEEIILFEGIAEESIEIPISRSAYSYQILAEGLKLEIVE